jgi:hypothetical protein
MSTLDWHDVDTGDGLPPEVAGPYQSAPPPPIAPATDSADQSERARVLRHPEIAARLCKPPLHYSRPEVWTGYVPPETWRDQHNDSPQRTALLDIITAAVKAEQEGT